MSTAGGPHLEGTDRGNDMLVCLDGTMLSATSSLPVKSGLEVWLDAADDDTFAYGTGTDVTTWSDKSGNGNDVVQTTAANMPTRIPYTTVTANPCSVVDFNGSTDSLSSTTTVDLATPGVYTQIVVWSCDVAGGDSGLISINNVLNSGITSHSGNSVYRYYGDGSKTLATYSLSTGNFYITGKVFPGAGGSVTKVGFQDGTKATSVGATSLTSASGVLRLGQQTSYFNGKIAEVIIYTRALSDAEMAQVDTYLNQKWNIATTDSKWYDLTASEINGTLQNDAAYSVEGRGCLDLDGTDDGIEVPSTQLDAVMSTSTMTVAVVYKMDASQSNPYPRIWDKGYALMHTTETSPFALYVNIYDDDLDFLQIGASNISVSDEWVFVTWTWDGTTSRLYKNGALVTSNTSGTMSGDIKSTSTSMKLGTNSFSGSTRDTAGQIGFFRVYDKTLTATEVKANFNTLRSRFGV